MTEGSQMSPPSLAFSGSFLTIPLAPLLILEVNDNFSVGGLSDGWKILEAEVCIYPLG